MRAWIVVGTLVANVVVARAEVELKNDAFVTNGNAAFQGGFIANEIGAARFVAPDATRSLQKIQFLFGPDDATPRTITVKVYDDSAGTAAPGVELSSDDFQIQGSSSGMQEVILPSVVPVPMQFRVGILFTHNNAPSIAADATGNAGVDKSFLFAIPGGWIRSPANGEWIIRAFVSGTGGTAPDAGPASGGDCNGNGDCPTGEFCDTAVHACTFECRDSTDCGGDLCNSLGQCVAGDRDGGGCCEAGQGGEAGIVLLGLGLGAVLLRRRRR